MLVMSRFRERFSVQWVKSGSAVKAPSLFTAKAMSGLVAHAAYIKEPINEA
ncbi:hypothetical protein CONPUDRAFT_160812 [Coniophora puteana RWD-64-598 SS2]|uniref:Uncharacterized protein n=1 Tax=Coniophora puteana (strain RWD-64-598) TaxID=741705 RepID=R7SD05_CONPW|nr:uncharacterized protein CONPUDRAFT_160812 [Coniophora puteana RWD-64-598 SS2]EIW73715.1 hypothetical protein CONPUDRAFT_160812 [Coniophora puteana RWD-64-598 SS2]